MNRGMEVLGAKRLTGIVQTLRDIRETPKQLLFLNRTRRVPAVDSEIMGRYDGNVIAADIIADDQKAVVRSTGSVTLESVKIPNLKHGELMTQEMMNLLERINSGGGIPRDDGIISDYKMRTMERLTIGVEHRMEALLVACAIDSFSYDRLGLKLSGVGWGMPADLKITIGTAWTTTATAKPIDDILAAKYLAQEKYGEMYDRVTMTSTDFRELIATDEFKAKAQLYSQISFPAGSFPSQDLGTMKNLVGLMLGMQVELYDSKYWQEAAAGTVAATSFLPAGKIVLSDSNDDNTGEAIDWANGIVTESTVSAMGSTGMIGGFDGPEYGPVGYATVPQDLNPPNLTLWAVARGFPRKHRLSSTAVLTNP